MKIFKKIFLLGIIMFSVISITKADVLPENSHRFDRCVKIENLNGIEGYKLVIWINTVVGNNQIYQVENDTCLQGHYKFGSSTPYLIKNDINLENLNNTIGKQEYLENSFGNIFTRFESINPNGGYISNNSNKTYENITYQLVADKNDYKLIMMNQETDGSEDSDLPKIITGYTTNLNNEDDEINNNNEDDGTNNSYEDPKEILNNGYTRELNNAYEFAYKNGITTKESINQANMYGSLNRIAMAKMLSQYAINVLKKSPDTRKNCSFSDVPNSLDEAYDYGVKLACQLGIMGINMPNNKFYPNGGVTRAEFATALSRLLYGTSDGTYNYYSTHLEVLKDNGIITDTNPNLFEKRGYVMLMLMRSN